MNSSDYIFSEGSALFELAGEKFEPDAFAGLIALRGSRARRRGDRLGRPPGSGRIAVRGIQTFRVEDRDGLTVTEMCRHLLNGVRDNLATIKRLAQEQELDWGILIFEGDIPEKGLAGVNRAVLDDAAALGVPIRQKFGL